MNVSTNSNCHNIRYFYNETHSSMRRYVCMKCIFLQSQTEKPRNRSFVNSSKNNFITQINNNIFILHSLREVPYEITLQDYLFCQRVLEEVDGVRHQDVLLWQTHDDLGFLPYPPQHLAHRLHQHFPLPHSARPQESITYAYCKTSLFRPSVSSYRILFNS